MPPPAKIALLPRETRAELDALLIRRAFSDYDGLSAWLSERR